MGAQIINPRGWPKPKGYSNGVMAEGRVLAIGGQIGWNKDQIFEHSDFVGQFGQALANVRAILDAAGAEPRDIVRMTVFVTDLDAYRDNLRALGPVWKLHLGRWYPAMSLVGVTGLVEPDALVEIETTAVLPPKERS
jgi:enamine deaminase RidA (YjgF/YER057c/UK114 family)